MKHKAKEIWIFGGGHSIMEQFKIPYVLREKVQSKELTPQAYLRYLLPLKDKQVLGINAAYMIGDLFSHILFVDECFWKHNKENLLKHPAQLVSFDNRHKNVPHPSIIHLGKDTGKLQGIHPDPTKICFNNSTGGAAINYAVHLGATKIVLLGFDMNGEKTTHFHNEYFWINNKPPFKEHLLPFKQIAKECNERGVEVLNASPNSSITAFKKVSVSDLLPEIKRRVQI